MSENPSLMNRRRLLKQTFAYSAALALGTRSSLSVAVTTTTGAAHHMLMIGDWGANDDLQAQNAVASGMKKYLVDGAIKPEAMMLLGDNFYGPFKEGVDCPRWEKQFEQMYPADVFACPCYAMLGNHDYDEEPKDKLAAELAYAKAHPKTRWKMPAKWYSFEHPKKNPLVKFIVLDSNYKNRVDQLTEEERATQLLWLKAELSKPRSTPWLVVMAHHPLYTNGMHGDNAALIADWDDLFKQYKVDFYFAGHDHDLQHMEFEGHPTSFVVSGGGGARTRSFEILGLKHGPFGQAIYGFSHLQVTKEQFIIKHIDANRNLLHAFSKNRDGNVTIQSV